jgi:hypothetical protein
MPRLSPRKARTIASLVQEVLKKVAIMDFPLIDLTWERAKLYRFKGNVSDMKRFAMDSSRYTTRAHVALDSMHVA